jgi:hypothetical protein
MCYLLDIRLVYGTGRFLLCVRNRFVFVCWRDVVIARGRIDKRYTTACVCTLSRPTVSGSVVKEVYVSSPSTPQSSCYASPSAAYLPILPSCTQAFLFKEFWQWWSRGNMCCRQVIWDGWMQSSRQKGAKTNVCHLRHPLDLALRPQ